MLEFFVIGLVVVALVLLVYQTRKHQVEDFRTWVLVEGIPVAFVTVLVLTVVWLVLNRF